MTPDPSAREPRPGSSRQTACYVKGCRAYARYTPILRVAQHDTEHISQIALPVRLCAGHRGVFPGLFLTKQRRATMEKALRARGRAAPDWSRTAVEFEGP